MKNLTRLLTVILVMVITVGLIIVLTVNYFSKFKIVQKSEISISAVLEKVKQVSQLDTVELYYNEILDFRSAIEINEIEIPFTEKSFIFFVKAKVQAGIDLSTLTEDDIKIEKKKITIWLNKPTITVKEILEYKAYSENDGFFNPVTNEDTLNMLTTFLVRLDKQAKENGILEKAEANAKLSLEGFLGLLGYEEVLILFKE